MARFVRVSLEGFARQALDRGGLHRTLPWDKDEGYYIGSYIGRDAERCDWDFARSAFSYEEARQIFDASRPTIRGCLTVQ